MKTKYIVIGDTKQGEIETMVVFPEHTIHRHMADDCRRAFGKRPVSAGFISITVDKKGRPQANCYGESESLGIKSRSEDSELANALFNFT